MENGMDITEALGIPQGFTLMTGTNGHSHMMKFVITGGCGYFGFKLAQSLHSLGADVCLLDMQLPPTIEKFLDSRLTFFKGDVCNYESFSSALFNVDCVFHVASYGLSGSQQLCRAKNEAVNVNGTKNVIRACHEHGVGRLIYTSTYNVVLEGKPIIYGDETLPYARPDKMVDYYSITKQKADQLVLSANNSENEGGERLRTCCIRPSGIYGPGEIRHMQRSARYIRKKIVLFKPGNAICDWVHVNNLIQAHLLAAHGLSKAADYIAAGQAYFISDNRPIAIMDFLRPLFIGLDSEIPRLQCPYFVMYFFAILFEFLHHAVKSVVVYEPFLTRTEVIKLSVDHYHSMEKAMKELGYRPKKYDFADAVAFYLRKCNSDTSYDSWIWFLIGLKWLLLLACFILPFYIML